MKVRLSGWIDGHKDYIHWSYDKDIKNLSDLKEGLNKFYADLSDLIAEYWQLYLYVYDDNDQIIAKFKLINKED